MDVILFDADEETFLFELLDDLRARVLDMHAAELAGDG